MSRFPTFATALVALAACGPRTRTLPQFDSAAPEKAAFQLALTESPAETAQPTLALAPVSDPCLAQTEDAVRGLNQEIADLLAPVAQALATEPAFATSALHEWPPVQSGNAVYLFSMRAGPEGQFAWELKAKSVGQPDSSFASVMTGAFTQGEVYRRGTGQIGFDLDRIANVDSAFHGAGGLYLAFSNSGSPAVLAFSLDAFTPDLRTVGPIAAVAYGVHATHGATNLRLASYGALCNDPRYGARGLVLTRVRWDPNVGGRADAISLLGDVPAGQAYVANAIWGRDQITQWRFVRRCDLVGLNLESCVPVSTEGSFLPCEEALKPEDLPPVIATSTIAEPGAAPLVPPTRMPTPQW